MKMGKGMKIGLRKKKRWVRWGTQVNKNSTIKKIAGIWHFISHLMIPNMLAISYWCDYFPLRIITGVPAHRESKCIVFYSSSHTKITWTIRSDRRKGFQLALNLLSIHALNNDHHIKILSSHSKSRYISMLIFKVW